MDDIVFISASSFAFFAATTAVLYRLRGPILKRLREALYIRICLVFFDGLLAIGIGAVISWLNLIQKSTWTDGDERLLFGMWSVGLMAGGFLSAKGLYLARIGPLLPLVAVSTSPFQDQVSKHRFHERLSGEF